MNAKELVIKGTEKVVAYACGRCGLVFRDSFAAERCCPNYVCRYCGAVTDPYHLACDACWDLARLRKARRVSLAEYGIAMVCVEGDRYLETEDVEPAVEEGEITQPWVWGCDFTPFRLDIVSAMENELQDHHEDAEFDHVDELEEFVERWNKKQTGGSYYIDHKTVVVLNAEQLDSMLQEFEFRAAMMGSEAA